MKVGAAIGGVAGRYMEEITEVKRNVAGELWRFLWRSRPCKLVVGQSRLYSLDGTSVKRKRIRRDDLMSEALSPLS